MDVQKDLSSTMFVNLNINWIIDVQGKRGNLEPRYMSRKEGGRTSVGCPGGGGIFDFSRAENKPLSWKTHSSRTLAHACCLTVGLQQLVSCQWAHPSYRRVLLTPKSSAVGLFVRWSPNPFGRILYVRGGHEMMGNTTSFRPTLIDKGWLLPIIDFLIRTSPSSLQENNKYHIILL